MRDPKIMDEMRFYAETSDYSDPERYDRFAKMLDLDRRARDIGDVVLSLFPSSSHLDILETAASTGLTAEGVQETLESFYISSNYTNLDIEPKLLEYSRSKGRGDSWIVGDFERLPFLDDSFDLYIMMGATGYREDTDTFYSEVSRVLKDDSYFLIPIIGPNPTLPESEEIAATKGGLTLVRNSEKYFIAHKDR